MWSWQVLVQKCLKGWAMEVAAMAAMRKSVEERWKSECFKHLQHFVGRKPWVQKQQWEEEQQEQQTRTTAMNIPSLHILPMFHVWTLDVEQEAIAAAKVCQEQRHWLRDATDANFRRLSESWDWRRCRTTKLLTSEAWTPLPLPQFVGMASLIHLSPVLGLGHAGFSWFLLLVWMTVPVPKTQPECDRAVGRLAVVRWRNSRVSLVKTTKKFAYSIRVCSILQFPEVENRSDQQKTGIESYGSFMVRVVECVWHALHFRWW